MEPIRNFDQLTSHLKTLNKRKRIAVVCANDPNTEYAIARALDEGIAEFLMIGDSAILEKYPTLKKYPEYVQTLHIEDKDEAAREAVRIVREGGADILIGTQMVSKGLDFDRVSVVGILNADSMLNYPDFRSYERAFQLMAQVAGRAGRKNKRGRVVLQTKSIEHPIIHQVIANDYEDMVGGQLAERQMFHYPPYYRLVYVYLKNHNEALLDQMAAVMADKLRAVFGNRVLGPDKPPVARIQTLFIKKIVVKIEQNAPMGRARELLLRIQREMLEDERYKSLIVYYDVDPM